MAIGARFLPVSMTEIQRNSVRLIRTDNSFWVRGSPDAPQLLIDWGLYTEPQVVREIGHSFRNIQLNSAPEWQSSPLHPR